MRLGNEDLLEVLSEYKIKFENCVNNKTDLNESVLDYIDKVNKLIEIVTTKPVKVRRRFPLNRSSFESNLLEEIKPLFDKFPNLERLRLAHWGRFYKYELAGSPYYKGFSEIDYCCQYFSDLDYQENETEFDKVMDEILMELLEGDYWIFNMLDRESLVKIYDFDDRGGATLEVYNDNGTLKIDFDDKADSNE